LTDIEGALPAPLLELHPAVNVAIKATTAMMAAAVLLGTREIGNLIPPRPALSAD